MISYSNATPNPGSAEARELGCTCSVIDNHYGRGVLFEDVRYWWMTSDCPLHGTEARRDETNRARE